MKALQQNVQNEALLSSSISFMNSLGSEETINLSKNSEFSKKKGGKMLEITVRKPMSMRKKVDFEIFFLQAPRSLMVEVDGERMADLRIIGVD